MLMAFYSIQLRYLQISLQTLISKITRLLLRAREYVFL